MDQLKQLSDFFIAIDDDPRINTTHIGLYVALIQYWSKHCFENPIHVFSYEIMRIAKMSAKTTYHKSIKDLSSFGYIKYEPSYKRTKGSKIYMVVHQSNNKREVRE
jgi:hypothetical protein